MLEHWDSHQHTCLLACTPNHVRTRTFLAGECPGSKVKFVIHGPLAAAGAARPSVLRPHLNLVNQGASHCSCAWVWVRKSIHVRPARGRSLHKWYKAHARGRGALGGKGALSRMR